MPYDLSKHCNEFNTKNSINSEVKLSDYSLFNIDIEYET